MHEESILLIMNVVNKMASNHVEQKLLRSESKLTDSLLFYKIL